MRSDGNPGPRENEIHIWRTSFQPWLPVSPSMITLLSQAEQDRALRLLRERARQEALLSRFLLRRILGSMLQRDPGEIQIRRNPTGKPFLPVESLVFNLSHSGDYFLCALARNLQVGIDIQERYPLADYQAMQRRWYSSQEKTAFRRLNPHQQQKAFFRSWVQKEALYKAHNTIFKETGGDPLLMAAALPGLQLIDLDIVPGYQAALAVNRPVDRILVIDFHPARKPEIQQEFENNSPQGPHFHPKAIKFP